MKVLVIPSNKPPFREEISGDLLEGLQKLVGGWIEPVELQLVAGDDYGFGCAVMYVNEEGLLNRLPVNDLATRLLHRTSSDPLVGDVVVVGTMDDEGNDTDCPEWLAAGLAGWEVFANE